MYVPVERLRVCSVPSPWKGYGYESGEREYRTEVTRVVSLEEELCPHVTVASILSTVLQLL